MMFTIIMRQTKDVDTILLLHIYEKYHNNYELVHQSNIFNIYGVLDSIAYLTGQVGLFSQVTGLRTV